MNQNLKDLLAITPDWVIQQLKAKSQNDYQLENLCEEFAERAGIIEFDGGKSRYEAEKLALRLILNDKTI